MVSFRTILAFSLAVSFGVHPVAHARDGKDGKDRHVSVENKTDFDVVELYASNVGEDSWQEDILGRDLLESGDTIRVNFFDGTGHCRFDFKVVFSDGDVAYKRSMDVCKVDVLVIH